MGSMSVRRFVSTVVPVVVCVLACASTVGVVPAGAATQFGSRGGKSGQFEVPRGVAVDQASGDVYIADERNRRVDKFDASGGFLTAWGWDVNQESPAEILQTCTNSCEEGLGGLGAGEFAFDEGAQAVAVDNSPSTPGGSSGDIYVVDQENFRVEKFSPSGEFILMFGGDVNENGGDVCAAGEKCERGTEGSGDGQFEWAYKDDGFIAVGPQDNVYVGDKARVQVFEPSGIWRETISLAALSVTGKVTALVVDGSGDVYVKDEEVPGVREFEPDGTEEATQFDAGSESVETLAMDGSDDLFVGDANGGFHVLEYGASGKELESFGSGLLGEAHGMSFYDKTGELYMAGPSADEVEGRVEPNAWIVALPPPGPVVESGSESAKPGLRGTATLEAQVDPEGQETTWDFEFVDATHYQSNGFADAVSTPSISIASGLFEDHPASASLTGLVPGATYHYRIVAHDSSGHMTIGPDQALEPTPPALIEGPWVTNVAATSATLEAQVNPLGANTEYRMEYGTSTSYGQVLSGSVGEGMGYVLISSHRQELQPGTTYHYRIVTTSEVGMVQGPDHTFTTQSAAGSELTLLDRRVWELVSPPDKKGGLIGSAENGTAAASDGSAITYTVLGPPMGEDTVGAGNGDSQVLSSRDQDGWRSQNVTLPQSTPPRGESVGPLLLDSQYVGPFSSNLSQAVALPGAWTSFSSEALEGTIYLRNNANGDLVPVLTPGDVPSGIKITGEHATEDYIKFWDGTPDMNHLIIGSRLALTPGAVASTASNEAENLYEWGAGHLQLVNILPNGKSSGPIAIGLTNAVLAGHRPDGTVEPARDVSNDGRRIAWTWGSAYGEESRFGGYRGLYVRDMVEEKTVRIGGPAALYQMMSSDGSRIFFLENGELYEFDMETNVQSDLTADHNPGEANADVQEAVSDVSEDGTYVYFVAEGVLARGAVSGEYNLYSSHDENGVWSTRYVATLSGEDKKSWDASSEGDGGGTSLQSINSRVSPDGRYLAFMSERPLTGYDNTDAVSGQPDEEVYIYDAVTNRLVCASCNPTGARPVGILSKASSLVDNNGSWGEKFEGPSGKITPAHWLAGNIRAWSSIYRQSRYLSDSGRLFFDSSDALVPQDTNGLEDAYEYEPAGVGGCTTASLTFNERSGGCVGLISSGTSSAESAFLDASENGDDAFFVTFSRLTPSDYDTSYDVYDAHVCSESAPCTVTAVSPPPCTSGDSCKPAASPQPETFGPPPSATFSGAGNVIQGTKNAVKLRRETKSKKHSKKHAKKKRKQKIRKSNDGKTIRKGGR